ncbi:MAG: helix-turn-helix domain-containing protein [Akkermansiaceae bacterium]
MDNFTGFKKEGFDQQKLFRLPTRAESRMLGRTFTRNLVVSDVGYYPRAERHLVERKSGLKSHILVFCLSGRGWFSSKGKRREVSAMDVFWIPAKEAHSYGAHRTDPWEIYWVHAYGTLVEELLRWTSLNATKPMASFPNTHALRRQFNALIQRLELGYTDHTLLELSRFFVSLINLLHVDSGSEREIEQKENIERAMDKMRQTVSTPLSLGDYARGAGLSISQFSHLFKRHYGTSPMAYFTELRIQRAKEMLDNTHLSIKEVSWKLGFEDQLYFSRLFKKVSGISPSAYRSEGC